MSKSTWSVEGAVSVGGAFTGSDEICTGHWERGCGWGMKISFVERAPDAGWC